MADTPPKPPSAAAQAYIVDPPDGKSTAKDKPQDKPPQQSRGRLPDLEKQLQQFFSMVGMGISVVPGLEADGQVILSRAEPLAKSWHDLAKQNPRVRRNLERMMQGGAWSGVIMVNGSVLLAILNNHGLLPELGAPAPEPEPEPEQEQELPAHEVAESRPGPHRG